MLRVSEYLPNRSSVRHLGELEEAVGVLREVSVCDDSLLVTMDSTRFSVDFHSMGTLELARKQLIDYIGKKVALFQDADPTERLYVRVVSPLRQTVAEERARSLSPSSP